MFTPESVTCSTLLQQCLFPSTQSPLFSSSCQVGFHAALTSQAALSLKSLMTFYRVAVNNSGPMLIMHSRGRRALRGIAKREKISVQQGDETKLRDKRKCPSSTTACSPKKEHERQGGKARHCVHLYGKGENSQEGFQKAYPVEGMSVHRHKKCIVAKNVFKKKLR